MQHVAASKAIIVVFLCSDTQKLIFSIDYDILMRIRVFL